MKDIHKNILVSFLSVALFFLVLEALMNIFVVDESIIIDNKTHKRGFYDSVIEYTTEGKQLKPNLDIMIKNHYLSHQDVHFVTDSFGFRGRDVSCGQSNECRKVLFLGDSVTLQNYLPEEYTFVGLLQRMYQRDDKGLRVKIINGGIWDVGIQEEYFILERKAILIKPDIVILDFYLNDSRPSRGFDREKRLNFLKLLQKSRLLSYLYRRLAVQSYLSKNKLTNNEFRFSWVEKSKNTDWMVNKKAFSDLINSADLDWGAAWQESSWIQVKEYHKNEKNSGRKQF